AVLRRPLLDLFEDLFESPAGNQRRVGADEPRRRFAERSRLTLIRNFHSRQSSVTGHRSYVKKGHHPPADDGPWCFVSGLTSSAVPLWPDGNKGNNSRDGHDDRQDNGTGDGGRARH